MFKANFQNFVYLFGRLAPMMMIFFFVFISILNKEWRGFIYLAGVIVSCAFAILMSNSFENFFASDANSLTIGMCSLTDKQFSKFPLSSVILGFTIMYLFLPMMNVYGTISNPYMFVSFLIFVCVDIMFLKTNRCAVFNISQNDFVNTLVPIAISYILGAFVAHIFVMALNSTGNQELLYFSKSSGSPLCNISNDNKFRCKVYKNGELVTSGN